MHLTRKPICVLVLFLLSVTAVRADKVDDYVNSEMNRQHVPGVSIVVLRNAKVIKLKGYGLANIELNVPASPETIYKIGSLSKQFIATGIMLLIEDGKLSLDDHVSQFLEGTPDSWKPITIRHLLTHTSGIVREAPGFDPLKIQSDVDVIKTAYPLPLRFAPGDKWEYCNVGYFTLAEIIHKVSGKPWPDFLNERVFAPLSMRATRTTTMTDLVPNRANGYYWENGKQQNSSIYFALRPSGAFLSNVIDLARWDAALYTDKILKKSSLDQMWTAVKLNNGTTYPYGFGWSVDTVAGHRQFHHGGSLPGFRSEITRFVDNKLTVVVLANSDNANAGLFALGVADFYIPGLIPHRVVTKVDPKIIDGHVGQYQTESSSVVTITREGGKLLIQQGTDGEKRELLPESLTNFFTRENPRVTFIFMKDQAGQEFLVGKLEATDTLRAKKIK